MQPFQSFRSYPHRVRMKSMLELADENNIGSTEFSNYLHAASAVIARDLPGCNDVEVLQTFIDFEIVMTEWRESNTTQESFNAMWCGRYNESMSLDEDFTFSVLVEHMKAKKTVFMYLDFMNYFIDLDEKTKLNKEMTTHSTALLAVPIGDSYSWFHFNPHGQAGIDTNTYGNIITRHRSHTTDLACSLDRWMLDKMACSFRNYLHANSIATEIKFDTSKAHNYVGPNWQSGDDYGICFAYPLYMLTEICSSYNSPTVLLDEPFNTTRRFPSYQRMLERGEFHRVIYVAMSKIFQDFRCMWLRHTVTPDKTKVAHNSGLTQQECDFNDEVEAMLEKQGTRYTKFIFTMLMRFLLQADIRRRVGNSHVVQDE